MQNKKQCLLCGSSSVKELKDFGMQPVTNRFPESKDKKEYLYPMVFDQCQSCSLLQLRSVMPASEMQPQVDWITYNEPEEHLDGLALTLGKLQGLTHDSKIVGITFKDDTLLNRLKKQGFKNISRLKEIDDLGITAKGVGVESIQEKITAKNLPMLIEKYGRPDFIVARHIVEHAHDLKDFAHTLHQWAAPGGYVFFEAPDCTRSLDAFDYSTLWEEHAAYFTPDTYRNSLEYLGFKEAYFENYPYPLENSLIYVGKTVTPPMKSKLSETVLSKELARGNRFAAELPRIASMFQELLSEVNKSGHKLAIFGAGHLACTFVNLLGLDHFFEFAVDDHPKKKGLYLPGSKMSILGSSELIPQNIKVCFTTLSKESEAKVVAKNQAYFNHGGIFISIFTDVRTIQATLETIVKNPVRNTK